MNPFYAINMTFLGAFLGAAALYLSALATGTLHFTPQQIAPIAFTVTAACAFFIASSYLQHRLHPKHHKPSHTYVPYDTTEPNDHTWWTRPHRTPHTRG